MKRFCLTSQRVQLVTPFYFLSDFIPKPRRHDEEGGVLVLQYYSARAKGFLDISLRIYAWVSKPMYLDQPWARGIVDGILGT